MVECYACEIEITEYGFYSEGRDYCLNCALVNGIYNEDNEEAEDSDTYE